MKPSIKLKLKIKDIELEFTQAELKELKSLLNEIFPDPQVIEKKEYYPWYPYIQPYSDRIYWSYTTNDTTPTVTWNASR